MEIREITAAECPAAALVLGRGMRDNPLHDAAFGNDPARREARFAALTAQMLPQILTKGAVLGAFSESKLVGVCGLVRPGRCQPTLGEKLQILPGIVLGTGLSAGLKVLSWSGAWAKRDAREPHWHLGPVGVEREMQGRGIGTLLMNEFCRRIDAVEGTAYLETDKFVNVAFL